MSWEDVREVIPFIVIVMFIIFASILAIGSTNQQSDERRQAHEICKNVEGIHYDGCMTNKRRDLRYNR
jgi:hypothetical protein